MIKNIFIPERLGQYYLFRERIVGLITKSNRINSIKLTRKGKDSAVESSKSFPLNEGGKAALEKLGKFNKLHLSLSNQDVIFKELSIPFLEHSKIKMVLPFEIESSLPFPLVNAYIDFIITGQNKEQKTSYVMAVITKKSELETLLEEINGTNNSNIVVTVPAVSTYCLYKNISESRASLLLEISINSISISYVDKNTKLRLVRTVPKGIELGSEPKSDTDAKWLTDEILFSINSFKTQVLDFEEPEKITIVWNRPPIDETEDFIYNNTNIETENFPVEKLKKIKNLKLNSKLGQEDIIALATAFTTEVNSNFNLLQAAAAMPTRQFIFTVAPSITIVALLLLSLIFIRKIKTNSMQNQITQSKQQVTSRLKEAFNITDKRTSKSLSLITKAAEKIVTEEENLWFSFSKKVRFSYLRYLEELSKIINKKEVGLTVNKLSIAEGVITLKGEVPSYPQLEVLERALDESKMFSHITRPEQLKFDIKITLKKNNEDE